MDRYFISARLNEVLDVNAHNFEAEQKVIKHPHEERWAVRVMPGNKYVQAKLEGEVVDSLPAGWDENH